MKTKHMVTLALFTTIALTIFMIESALPNLAPIPGIKLGLANIITLILILHYTNKDAFLVLLMRIILGSVFAGQAMSFLYSLAGGLACFCVMVLLNKIFRGKYTILVSMAGGLFHNIAQILVAVLITANPGAFAYLPFLIISGLVCGFFTGAVAQVTSRHMSRLPYWMILFLLLACCGCGKTELYTVSESSLFNTVITVRGYAKSQETFEEEIAPVMEELTYYHRLFDIYGEYEGIHNLCTVNANAGAAPVSVEEPVLDLLEYAIDLYYETDGAVNIAMGSVLSIWHTYRTEGNEDPDHASLPPVEALQQAAEHTNIEDIIIDREAGTVYLADKELRLDVGAVAKGFSAQRVCEKAREEGWSDLLLNMGGNVCAIGTHKDGSAWRVGVQNPDKNSSQASLCTVSLVDAALVTSGVYERYYYVGDTAYHHIIDPETLMPSDRYESVTILCSDSGLADGLSTALFNTDLEKGQALLKNWTEVEAMWVLPGGEIVMSEGFSNYIQK